MRLTRCNFRGRPGFGEVVGKGLVALRARLERFAALCSAAVAQA
jgi:hypothetical protein